MFTRALDLSPRGRDELLAGACSDDPALRREVVNLLAAHDAILAEPAEGDRFLEQLDAERAVALVDLPLLRTLRDALGDRYAVERRLGSGGMGEVFAARDLRHDRMVAIKIVRQDRATPQLEDRFENEVRIAARLQHPHIVPLYDSGLAAGHRYYVMPLVDGPTLRQRLQQSGRFPIDEALRIVEEIAGALDYAHGSGIVHRDIKPENVLLSGGHALVVDFGVARPVADMHASAGLSAGSCSVGTPAYMSPEQAAGRRVLDGHSDQYALACVAYELLTGRPPFTGETVQTLITQHCVATVPALELGPAGPSPALDAVMARALAKEPAARFASTIEFASALRAAAPAPSFLAGMSRRSWRLMVSGVAVAVVAGAILMLRLTGQPTPQPSPVYQRTAIAVLPFDNLSAGGPHAYFAGGLHTELQTQLSKVAALTVISRTSVMGYAGANTPLRQIASELRVGSVVEASVQVVGARLRVNVALIDAATGAHLWAERYDRAVDDAFAIQSNVAQQIVAAVGAALSRSEQQGIAAVPTTNAEAYRLYLQGRDYWNRPGYLRQNYEIAERLFERALVLDPGFALARATLSAVHGQMYFWSYDNSPTRSARQREEAEAALRLAPDLPEAHAAIGLAQLLSGGDYQLAVEEFDIALKGLPSDAKVWGHIGSAHRRLGNWSEVVAAFEKATQLNPRDPNLFYTHGGLTYLFVHRYADAVGAWDQALSLAPDFHAAAVMKGRTYAVWRGQLDTLRAVLGRIPSEADLGWWRTKADQHVQLLLWERNADSLLHVATTPGVRFFEDNHIFVPGSLYAAWAHQLRGEHQAAYAAFGSALVLLDSELKKRPDDFRVHAARGLALAGLGRRTEARREARWFQQTAFYRKDAFIGPLRAEDRARILAQTGDADAALDEIERLLAGPSWVSVHALRLDPRWDPIRDHPRFKALLAKYGAR